MSRVFDTSNANYLLSASAPAAYNINSTNQISWAFWVKRAADGGHRGLVSGGSVKAAQLLFGDGAGGAGNKLELLGLGESFFGDSGANTILTADGWVHLAFTHNATSGAWIMYKNGANIGSGTNTGTFFNGQDSILLGKDGTFAVSANGKMAYAAIWKTVLSGANITSLQTSSTPESINGSNCIGSWHLNGAGGDLTDYSATGVDMTVQGTVAGDADDPTFATSSGKLIGGVLLSPGIFNGVLVQ
jgi:hypothetical protein